MLATRIRAAFLQIFSDPLTHRFTNPFKCTLITNTLITAYQTTTNSFIHLQIFIEPYYVPGTVLAAGDTKLLNFSEREMRSTDAQRK